MAFANAHALNVAARDENFGLSCVNRSSSMTELAWISLASFFLDLPFHKISMGQISSHTIFRTRGIAIASSCSAVAQVSPRAPATFSQDSFLSIKLLASHHGYFVRDDTAKINAMIKASNADVVLVGNGQPATGVMAREQPRSDRRRLGFAVGGLFDFRNRGCASCSSVDAVYPAGVVLPAHQGAMRLARRYLIGNPLFIFRIMVQRILRVPANIMTLKLP